MALPWKRLGPLGVLAGLVGLAWVFQSALPKSLDDLRAALAALKAYQSSHPASVLAYVAVAYLLKQTFALPGSAMLNVLVGGLYPAWGLPLVCGLTATGASLCFLVSKHFIGPQLEATPALASRLAKFRGQVAGMSGWRLFVYLVSLRLLPFTPNWFINLASPHVGIPLGMHFAAILLGLAPYNFITMEAASTLGQVETFADLVDSRFLFKIAGLGLGLVAAVLVAGWVVKPSVAAASEHDAAPVHPEPEPEPEPAFPGEEVGIRKARRRKKV